jgi:hypothetical protein
MRPEEGGRQVEAFYGVAAGLGGIAQFASIGSAFWLGGRLLNRAGRAGGGVPELLLGLHLWFAIGLGSLCLSIASTSAYLPGRISPALFGAFTIGGNIATLFGLMAALWFNYRVFHDGQRVGRIVAGFVSALMWLGFALYLYNGGMQMGDLYGPASWPYVATMVLADVWLVRDALGFRAQLRRRLALGLADPIVVDRLLLWSGASIARIGLVLIAPATSVLVGGTTELRLSLVPALLAVSASLIFLATVSLWLMLAPTEAYRRWVERRYASAGPSTTVTGP